MGCNGEIYNYKELISKYDLKMKSHTDTETIILLYLQKGIDFLLNEINGEFAFYIIDIDKENKKLKLYLARDQCGIRPLFYGEKNGSFAFSSEMKGLMFNLGQENVE